MLHPDNGPITPGGTAPTSIRRSTSSSTRLYAAGRSTFTAQVWSAGCTSIDDEPDSENNLRTEDVEFHTAEVPTVWLVALDDGGGPGPDVTDLTVLLGYAQAVNQDLLDYMPLGSISFQGYPEPVSPGPEAAEPGLWDLDLDADDDPTAGDRRHEPNLRMAWLAELGEFPDADNVLGVFDESVPSGGWTGWAGYGVAWTKPVAGTPAHEVGHTQGLQHVDCMDDDGDGVSTRPRRRHRLVPPDRAAPRLLAGPDRPRRLLRVHQLPEPDDDLQQRPGPSARRLPVHELPAIRVDRPVPLVPAPRRLRRRLQPGARSASHRQNPSRTSTASRRSSRRAATRVVRRRGAGGRCRDAEPLRQLVAEVSTNSVGMETLQIATRGSSSTSRSIRRAG